MDNFLILNHSKEGAERDFRFKVDLLMKCGFLVKWEKSLGVFQKREFVGHIVNSRSLALSFLPRKNQQIMDICRKARASKFISLRAVAKILGHLRERFKRSPSDRNITGVSSGSFQES